MKKLYFLFIFFILTFCIYAQQTKSIQYDSLKTIANDSLKELAISYRFKNSAKAKIYAAALYKRAFSLKELMYDASHINALIYNILEKKDSAHYFVDIAIDEAEKNSNKQRYINSLQLKGNIYYDAQLYNEAIVAYTEVQKLVEKENDIEKLADIRHSIALVRNQIGYPKHAIELVKKNLTLYDKGILDKEKLETKYINTLLNLSNTYINLSDNFVEGKLQYLDSAEVYNTRGLAKSLLVNDLEGHSIFLMLKAIIAQNRGNLENAHINFKETEKQINELGFKNQLSILYQYHGKNFFLQKDYDNAIEYLSKVDSIVVHSKTSTPAVQETYLLLAKCYEKNYNSELAIKYFKIFEEKDKRNDILSSQVSQNIYQKYDIPSFEHTIKKLQSQSQKEQLKSTTLIYVCGLLILISMLGFWYYKNREQTHKKRFQNLLKELQEAENAENNTQEKKSQPYIITDENIRKILEGLEKFESKKLFLKKKCTLNYVAKKVHTNSTYLSKTLQSHKQKKFVQYITDLRINYALTQLKKDKKFRTYDIKSIASELGFNTSESFSKAFKKRTGIYPSFYIKNLNDLR